MRREKMRWKNLNTNIILDTKNLEELKFKVKLYIFNYNNNNFYTYIYNSFREKYRRHCKIENQCQGRKKKRKKRRKEEGERIDGRENKET